MDSSTKPNTQIQDNLDLLKKYLQKALTYEILGRSRQLDGGTETTFSVDEYNFGYRINHLLKVDALKGTVRNARNEILYQNGEYVQK